MPTPGTLTILAFFLAAIVGSGLWLLRVERPALRPAMTGAILAVTLGGYAAVWITVIRHA
jgi:hypothetical protein